MSESVLPPSDRSEGSVPRKGETFSAFLERTLVEDHGGEPYAVREKRLRSRLSQEERVDLILRGLDPDAPGVDG